MDVLTISMGWIGGYPVAGPTPPPTPTDTGDGVLLASDLTSSAYARRFEQAQERANPWADLIAWLRRLRRIDRQWEDAQLLKRIEADDQEIIELTGLTQRRR